MFKPKPLTLQQVFERLKEIALMIGNAVSFLGHVTYFSSFFHFKVSDEKGEVDPESPGRMS